MLFGFMQLMLIFANMAERLKTPLAAIKQSKACH